MRKTGSGRDEKEKKKERDVSASSAGKHSSATSRRNVRQRTTVEGCAKIAPKTRARVLFFFAHTVTAFSRTTLFRAQKPREKHGGQPRGLGHPRCPSIRARQHIALRRAAREGCQHDCRHLPDMRESNGERTRHTQQAWFKLRKRKEKVCVT